MEWGSSATSILVGVVGGVLLVAAVVLGGRLGARRAAGTAGVGLVLLGLTVSGLVDVLASIAFNPVRWVGVGSVVVGLLLLFGSGMLPRRRRAERGAAEDGVERGATERPAAPGSSAAGEVSSSTGDREMDEIEEILRRRGIS